MQRIGELSAAIAAEQVALIAPELSAPASTPEPESESVPSEEPAQEALPASTPTAQPEFVFSSAVRELESDIAATKQALKLLESGQAETLEPKDQKVKSTLAELQAIVEAEKSEAERKNRISQLKGLIKTKQTELEKLKAAERQSHRDANSALRKLEDVLHQYNQAVQSAQLQKLTDRVIELAEQTLADADVRKHYRSFDMGPMQRSVSGSVFAPVTTSKLDLKVGLFYKSTNNRYHLLTECPGPGWELL